MDLLTPPPSFEDPTSPKPSQDPPDQKVKEEQEPSESRSGSPTKRSPPAKKIRALVGGNLGTSNALLSKSVQHPLRSRENSPEHFMQPPPRQPVRAFTPLRESTSPPPSSSTFTSPDGAHTPPSTIPPATWSDRHPPESDYGYPGSVMSVPPSPSTLSFEVLSGYEPISPAEKVLQHQREMMMEQERQRRQGLYELGDSERVASRFNGGDFRPNASLGFPISEGLRRFYPNAPTREDFRNSQNIALKQEVSEDSEVFKGVHPTEYFERFHAFANSTKERFTGSGSSRAYHKAQVMEELDEQEEDHESNAQVRETMSYAEQRSQISSGTSGIPSYSKEFDNQQRWRHTESRHSTISRSSAGQCIPAGSFSPIASPTSKEGLLTAYVREFKTQLEIVLHFIKRPLCFILAVGGLGLVLSTLFTSIAAPILCHNPGFETVYGCQSYLNYHGFVSSGNGTATYPDFPTLMNIESSFEKIVDGAAGGTALARSMKQSELAVSDLSTVVKYSDLKCKESLSEKLDAFATDAKASVRALSGWGSKVGGVLDQLLSINQYSLRELNALKESESQGVMTKLLAPVNSLLRPLVYSPAASLIAPFIPSSTLSSTRSPASPATALRNSPRTRAQIAATFNKAAEVLENNLRLLVSDGETIFDSLTRLSEQHKPIYDEIVREVVDIKKEEEAVLSSLWTKMGGNASQRKNFRENANLLSTIRRHEEEARGYVESTVLELDRMMGDLEVLRKRVAEPLLRDDAAVVPGVATGDIPLQVHIEAIEKAVERLVQKRGERREREESYLKKIAERQEKGPKEELLFDSRELGL